jgi:hypothetical protein
LQRSECGGYTLALSLKTIPLALEKGFGPLREQPLLYTLADRCDLFGRARLRNSEKATGLLKGKEVRVLQKKSLTKLKQLAPLIDVTHLSKKSCHPVTLPKVREL